MQAQLQPMPQRRESRSALNMAARAFVDALALEPPQTSDPGHWKTADGFLAVSTALVRTTRGRPDEKLRLLVSFHAEGIQERCKQLIASELPQHEQMSEAERRQNWVRILQIGKQVRTERVVDVLDQLHQLGIEIDPSEVVVHRVSNTFFASIDVRNLRRLLTLRAHGQIHTLRRMQTEKRA